VDNGTAKRDGAQPRARRSPARDPERPVARSPRPRL